MPARVSHRPARIMSCTNADSSSPVRRSAKLKVGGTSGAKNCGSVIRDNQKVVDCSCGTPRRCGTPFLYLMMCGKRTAGVGLAKATLLPGQNRCRQRIRPEVGTEVPYTGPANAR